MDVNMQILHELKNLGARMIDIENKVHSIEDKKSSVMGLPTPSSSKRPEAMDDKMVLPSLDSLQASSRIQAEANARTCRNYQKKASVNPKEVDQKLCL